MAYIALYRKWRPQTLQDVTGQNHIVFTLKNQLHKKRISHAYLFAGPRGTGKTSTAKILAKALNCTNSVDAEPCSKCSLCREITAGSLMDVIEIDAASNNGVDEIRELRQNVQYPPATGKYKVYIIDEVHMLSAGAFNALLKTLEEPPAHAVFILATTEPQKIPATILSRCQRFDFKRLSLNDITHRVLYICEKDNIQIEKKAADYICRLAEGSLRDALSILDQCIALQSEIICYEDVISLIGAVNHEVLFNIVEAIHNKHVASIIEYIHNIIMSGKDISVFVRDLIMHLRSLLIIKTCKKYNHILELSDGMAENYERQAKELSEETIVRGLKLLSDCEAQLKRTGQGRVLIETTVIELCEPQLDDSLPALLDRVCRIERLVEQGVISNNTDRKERAAVTGDGHGKEQDNFDKKLHSVKNKNNSNTTDKNRSTKNISGVIAKNTDEYDVNKIRKHWPDILEQVKKASIKLYSYYSGAEAVDVHEKTLNIGVDNGFCKSALETQANKKIIEEIIEEATSYKPVFVKYVVNVKKEAKPKDGEALINSAYAIFGKDKVEVID